MPRVIQGGAKLEAALKQIANNLGRGGTLRVGFLEGATYPDGTSVPMVAAIQNFGAPSRGIPPRPFFSNMVAEKSGEWPDTVARELKKTNYNATLALARTGAYIAGQLRESIVDTFAPPLSPITLMLRKMKADDPDLVVTGRTVGEAARRVKAGKSYAGVSTKPLVDTGFLLSRVDFEVEA